jgi:hypothetical protein
VTFDPATETVVFQAIRVDLPVMQDDTPRSDQAQDHRPAATVGLIDLVSLCDGIGPGMLVESNPVPGKIADVVGACHDNYLRSENHVPQ